MKKTLNLHVTAGVERAPTRAFVPLVALGDGLLANDAYQAALRKAEAIEQAVKTISQGLRSVRVAEKMIGAPGRLERDTSRLFASIYVLAECAPEIDVALRVLDAGLRAGGHVLPLDMAGRSSGCIFFALADEQEAKMAAIEEGVRIARRQAERVCGAGRKVGDVLEMSEHTLRNWRTPEFPDAVFGQHRWWSQGGEAVRVSVELSVQFDIS
jgi:hypothetical protein